MPSRAVAAHPAAAGRECAAIRCRMGKKQKIARIEAALASARAALAENDPARIENATSELSSAVRDASDHAYELGAYQLLERMRARRDELEVSALERTLT